MFGIRPNKLERFVASVTVLAQEVVCDANVPRVFCGSVVVGQVDARLIVFIDWDRSADELTGDAFNYVYDHSNMLTIMDSAMYSASAKLSATADCNLLPKQIRSPLRRMSHPVRDLRDALQFDQSESTCPATSQGSVGDFPEDENKRPWSAVWLA